MILTDDASVDASGGVGVRGSRKKWTTSARLFKRNSNVTVVKTYHIYNILQYGLIVIRIIVYTFVYKWLCLACSWTKFILSSAYQRLWQTIFVCNMFPPTVDITWPLQPKRRKIGFWPPEVSCSHEWKSIVSVSIVSIWKSWTPKIWKKKKRLYSVVSFTH